MIEIKRLSFWHLAELIPKESLFIYAMFNRNEIDSNTTILGAV